MAAVYAYTEPHIPLTVICAREHQPGFSGLLFRQPFDFEHVQENPLILVYQEYLYFCSFLIVGQGGERNSLLTRLVERKEAGITGVFNFDT